MIKCPFIRSFTVPFDVLSLSMHNRGLTTCEASMQVARIISRIILFSKCSTTKICLLLLSRLLTSQFRVVFKMSAIDIGHIYTPWTQHQALPLDYFSVSRVIFMSLTTSSTTVRLLLSVLSNIYVFNIVHHCGSNLQCMFTVLYKGFCFFVTSLSLHEWMNLFESHSKLPQIMHLCKGRHLESILCFGCRMNVVTGIVAPLPSTFSHCM